MCPYCKEQLTNENTSPASEGEGLCQKCYTEMVEVGYIKP